MRYIELNPAPAKMVDSPDQHQWSGFQHNSGAKKIELIQEHACYRTLGSMQVERHPAYLELFREDFAAHELKQI